MTDRNTLMSYAGDVETAIDRTESANNEARDELDSLRNEIEEACDDLDELEEWRELGDLDDVRIAVEDCDPTRVRDLEEERDELKRLCERQAGMIARLATAIDEINTITTDELIGTGGEQ